MLVQLKAWCLHPLISSIRFLQDPGPSNPDVSSVPDDQTAAASSGWINSDCVQQSLNQVWVEVWALAGLFPDIGLSHCGHLRPSGKGRKSPLWPLPLWTTSVQSCARQERQKSADQNYEQFLNLHFYRRILSTLLWCVIFSFLGGGGRGGGVYIFQPHSLILCLPIAATSLVELCGAIQHCTVPYCIIQYCTVPYCTIM